MTGRPWQALRTPTITLGRLKGSVAPLRLTTTRVAFSAVVNRRPHSAHWRRRRIAAPSSAVRESTTRVSVARQKGQYMADALLSAGPPQDRAADPWSDRLAGGLGTDPGDFLGRTRENLGTPDHNLWRTYRDVTTRCRGTVRFGTRPWQGLGGNFLASACRLAQHSPITAGQAGTTSSWPAHDRRAGQVVHRARCGPPSRGDRSAGRPARRSPRASPPAAPPTRCRPRWRPRGRRRPGTATWTEGEEREAPVAATEEPPGRAGPDGSAGRRRRSGRWRRWRMAAVVLLMGTSGGRVERVFDRTSVRCVHHDSAKVTTHAHKIEQVFETGVRFALASPLSRRAWVHRARRV